MLSPGEEAERINVGEWHWDGRSLSLEWWRPVTDTDLASKRSELRWIKAFGIPLHTWSLDTFKTIGESCGGYIGVDEDTKHINHLLWPRICIRNTEAKTPSKINLDKGEWKFEISLVDDVSATPRFAGKSKRSCSSGVFPVAANIEISYPAVPLSGHKHMGGQVEKPHFNSKISEPFLPSVNAKPQDYSVGPSTSNYRVSVDLHLKDPNLETSFVPSVNAKPQNYSGGPSTSRSRVSKSFHLNGPNIDTSYYSKGPKHKAQKHKKKPPHKDPNGEPKAFFLIT